MWNYIVKFKESKCYGKRATASVTYGTIQHTGSSSYSRSPPQYAPQTYEHRTYWHYVSAPKVQRTQVLYWSGDRKVLEKFGLAKPKRQGVRIFDLSVRRFRGLPCHINPHLCREARVGVFCDQCPKRCLTAVLRSSHALPYGHHNPPEATAQPRRKQRGLRGHFGTFHLYTHIGSHEKPLVSTKIAQTEVVLSDGRKI